MDFYANACIVTRQLYYRDAENYDDNASIVTWQLYYQDADYADNASYHVVCRDAENYVDNASFHVVC